LEPNVSIIIFRVDLEVFQEFSKSFLGLGKNNAFQIESLWLCVYSKELCLMSYFKICGSLFL